MNLKEYIKKLQELEKDYGDSEVWYSRDDNGNGYQMVNYAPSIDKKGVISDISGNHFCNQCKNVATCEYRSGKNYDKTPNEKEHLCSEKIIIIN